LTYVGVSAIED